MRHKIFIENTFVVGPSNTTSEMSWTPQCVLQTLLVTCFITYDLDLFPENYIAVKVQRFDCGKEKIMFESSGYKVFKDRPQTQRNCDENEMHNDQVLQIRERDTLGTISNN